MLQDRKIYTVCKQVHASSSPEVLQAGAVKGLRTLKFMLCDGYVHNITFVTGLQVK